MNIRSFLMAAAVILSASPARAATAPADPCASRDGMIPICGLNKPEDLELSPDGKALIVSEMSFVFDDQGYMKFTPGQLSLLDTANGARRVLYPTAKNQDSGRNIWGEPSCSSIGAALSPHGIHLSRRPDGKRQLLVVNHGQRSSVEFFEVKGKGKHMRLSWRGCVAFPDSVELNDVAALPKGGFVVTAIVFGGGGFVSALKKAVRGMDTGFVLRWQPGIGTDLLPGSLAPLPNGIQVSPDGTSVFIAARSAHAEVRKIDLATGTVVGKITVGGSDNLSWARDGRLIVGMGPILAPGETCSEQPMMGLCGSLYKIVAIDPATMATETVLERRNAPIKLVSVAVEGKDAYYFGTPMGKNVLKVPKGAK